MNRICTLLIISICCLACNNPQTAQTVASQPASPRDSIVVTSIPDTTNTDEEMAHYYLVILDSGKNYAALDAAMLQTGRSSGTHIDTMERHFDTKKHKIILSEQSDDEIYAGTYYPRRFPSPELSIEYLSYYLPSADTNTMILVAGITESATSADSVAAFYRRGYAKTFVLPADIYTGCMH
ncbi:MAG: hypothetical protein QM743_03225 [Chitinophagaceae bacterium]